MLRSKDVDYIMVTDTGSDVDFYEDMSHLNDTQLIDGLGAGASDAYGVWLRCCDKCTN